MSKIHVAADPVHSMEHGTDLCIYNGLNALMCSIDAFKAFDCVDQSKLFFKLIQRGMSKHMVRILAYWFTHQTLPVKWSNSVSAPFAGFLGGAGNP